MTKQADIWRLEANAASRILAAFRHGGVYRKGRRVATVRQKVLIEIETAYGRGYNDGHEDQMRARIRDAQERREKEPA